MALKEVEIKQRISLGKKAEYNDTGNALWQTVSSDRISKKIIIQSKKVNILP